MTTRKTTPSESTGKGRTVHPDVKVAPPTNGDVRGADQPRGEGVLPADEFFDRISQREDIKAILRRLAE
jgi:hypothetical protein